MKSWWSVAPVMALVWGLSSCKKESEVPPPPRAVMAYEVTSADKMGVYRLAGEVKPRVEAALAFRLPGKLVERVVDVGDAVRPGQVLARIDPDDARLAWQAQRAQVVAAEADRDLAQAELARTESLRAKNFVSQAALDARRTALAAAEQRLRAAQAQAGVAENQAGYVELQATEAGVVSAVMAERGQVLGAGQPVLRVAGSGAQEVAVSLAESRVRDLRVGQPVDVVLWADEGNVKHYPAFVREIAPAADPVTRTFAARVALQKPDPAIRLGMTATVLVGGRASGVVEVPPASIVHKETQPAVWVLGEGGTLALRPVQVKAFREDGVIVSAGLEVGERIVAAGGHLLMAGETVRVLERK